MDRGTLEGDRSPLEITRLDVDAKSPADAARQLLEGLAAISEDLVKTETMSGTIRISGRPFMTVAIATGVTAGTMLEAALNEIHESVRELRTCRFCGCSDDHACTGGCSWIAQDVCDHPACVECLKEERGTPS